MTDAERRRLHGEKHLAALLDDTLSQPAIRAALQVGAKVGESRRRRGAFLTGLLLGLLLGAILAVLLVRLGALESRP